MNNYFSLEQKFFFFPFCRLLINRFVLFQVFDPNDPRSMIRNKVSPVFYLPFVLEHQFLDPLQTPGYFMRTLGHQVGFFKSLIGFLDRFFLGKETSQNLLAQYN